MNRRIPRHRHEMRKQPRRLRREAARYRTEARHLRDRASEHHLADWYESQVEHGEPLTEATDEAHVMELATARAGKSASLLWQTSLLGREAREEG